MEDPSDANRADQPAAHARRFRPPVKYVLIAAPCLGLLAFALFRLSDIANRESTTNRGHEPPGPPNEPVDQAIRGRLQFGSLPSHLRADQTTFEGTNVGVEDDHRRYIAGHPATSQRAIWHFDKLPRSVTSPSGDVLRARLTCSIFRLAEGTPDAVVAIVRVVSHTCPQTPPGRAGVGEWQWADAEARTRYLKRCDEFTRAGGLDLRCAKPGTGGWKAVNQLAEEYGYHEARLPAVLHITETDIDLPLGLFRRALESRPEADADGHPKRPVVSIYLKCETEGLLLGVAESDLYLVEKPGAK